MKLKTDFKIEELDMPDMTELTAKLNSLMQPIAARYAERVEEHITSQLTRHGLTPDTAVLVWPTLDLVRRDTRPRFATREDALGSLVVDWELPAVVSRTDAERLWPELFDPDYEVLDIIDRIGQREFDLSATGWDARVILRGLRTLGYDVIKKEN